MLYNLGLAGVQCDECQAYVWGADNWVNWKSILLLLFKNTFLWKTVSGRSTSDRNCCKMLNYVIVHQHLDRESGHLVHQNCGLSSPLNSQFIHNHLQQTHSLTEWLIPTEIDFPINCFLHWYSPQHQILDTLQDQIQHPIQHPIRRLSNIRQVSIWFPQIFI